MWSSWMMEGTSNTKGHDKAQSLRARTTCIVWSCTAKNVSAGRGDELWVYHGRRRCPFKSVCGPGNVLRVCGRWTRCGQWWGTRMQHCAHAFLSGHGVHLACVDRQETSIINDEVNARTVCKRSCSPVASLVLRERRILSQSRWRRPQDQEDLRPHGAWEGCDSRVRSWCHDWGLQEAWQQGDVLLLRRGCEFALNDLQVDVKARRNYLSEDRCKLPSRRRSRKWSNGASCPSSWEVGEKQVRVVRHGREMRQGMKISSRHPVMIWRIEHVGDLMWKMTARQDIRYREEASTAVMKWSSARRSTTGLKETTARKVAVQADWRFVLWQHVAHGRGDNWHWEWYSQIWSDTRTPRTSTLGYKSFGGSRTTLDVGSKKRWSGGPMRRRERTWRRRRRIAMFIDIVCHERISRTTDSRSCQRRKMLLAGAPARGHWEPCYPWIKWLWWKGKKGGTGRQGQRSHGQVFEEKSQRRMPRQWNRKARWRN